MSASIKLAVFDVDEEGSVKIYRKSGGSLKGTVTERHVSGV